MTVEEAVSDSHTIPDLPCICNSTFYKSCPKDANCAEDKLDPEVKKASSELQRQLKDEKITPRFRSGDDYDDHDYSDPDHRKSELLLPTIDDYSNDDSADFTEQDVDLERSREKLGLVSSRAQELPPPSNTESRDESEDEEKFVRHRKVYVARKETKDPIIHPVHLTIPVSFEEAPTLPTPKPVYKLRKFTTYEQKPEVKMVPVTKTIYKPADITPDQIID